MNDKLAAVKQKLKSTVVSPRVAYPVGALIGSVVTAYVIHLKTQHDYDHLLTLPLGHEAFNALVNDETNFVRFWTGKHNHAFRVILDQ